MGEEAIGAIASASGNVLGSLFGAGGFFDHVLFTKSDREERNLTAQQIAANQTAANADYIRAQAELENSRKVAVDDTSKYLKILVGVIGALIVVGIIIALLRWIMKGS